MCTNLPVNSCRTIKQRKQAIPKTTTPQNWTTVPMLPVQQQVEPTQESTARPDLNGAHQPQQKDINL